MEKLYMGVAREMITPEVGGHLYGYAPDVFSDSVEDDLTATAFYFKQGATEAMMMTVTVCSLNTKMINDFRGVLAEQLGMDKKSCMISATHTHSGPNTNGGAGWGDIDSDYVERILLPRLMSAAEKAKASPVAVTVGTASGNSFVGVNRRELAADNKIKLGQNPWGCFNPRMTVVSFKNEAGEAIANIVHYGCHGTAAGRNSEITRDWSGVMIDELERQSGAITAFFNGTIGDAGPRLSNGKTVGSPGEGIRYVHELGAVAAQDAVRIYKEIYDYQPVKLLCDCATVSIPLKPRMPLEEAKALYEENKDETINYRGRMRDYALKTIAAYEHNEPMLKSVDFEQAVIALGNLVFVSFPYETFSEIGLRIDGCFQDKRVLSLSNTNGGSGYFVTEDAICRGGYEVTMFMFGQPQPYCDHADFELMQRSVAHIKKVFGEEG